MYKLLKYVYGELVSEKEYSSNDIDKLREDYFIEYYSSNSYPELWVLNRPYKTFEAIKFFKREC